MERYRLVRVVGREADKCATSRGQGHYGRNCDWSILQAVAAGGQRYTRHITV